MIRISAAIALKTKELYLRWNLRSDDGRKAGVGVYLAKFKLKVYGERNLILMRKF